MKILVLNGSPKRENSDTLHTVSLIGTLAVMLLMGFSINTLTLFGLILAIAIVVDDAIVVVENATRIIDDEGLSPREATEKAMDEITGPIIGVVLVMLAVFIPTTMIGGISGELYKQIHKNWLYC
mgnify:CR=1 FL=1